MVDMRKVRPKISAGAPTRELYTQHAAQKAVAVPSLPQAPPAVEPVPPVTIVIEPEQVVEPARPTPPPMPEASRVVAPPVVAPAPPVVDSDEPPRPSFKEPPFEDDDFPPRPSFKEPSPEPDEDYTPLPMPNFVDPPVSPPATPPPEAVTPTPQSKPTPVPIKRDSLINRANSPSPGAAMFRSRSPSPSDEALNTKASLSRSSSGQGSGYVRGPRASHGPRPPGGGVASMVSSLNKNSVGGSPTAPSYKRQSVGSSTRPQSMVGAVAQDTRARGIGRTQALSRRTMASDAEDEVVQ
jgi:hypothetical protein